MAYILVTATYPPNKGIELAKIWLSGKQPKYPHFIKRIHQFVVADNESKNYALYECEDDKIMESMKAILSRYIYYSVVEGFRYKTELLMEAREALKIAGLV